MQSTNSSTVLVAGARVEVQLIPEATRRIARLIIFLVLCVMAAPGTASQEEEAAPMPARDAMPVTLANRTIIILRGPLLG